MRVACILRRTVGALVLATLLCACMTPVNTQTDLTGRWVGTATTAGAGSIYYEWNLTQSGQNVEGTIYLALPDQSSYGLYDFSGTFDGQTLSYTGGAFSQRVPANADWCSAAGALTYTYDGNGQRLRGSWGPNSAAAQGCPVGASGQVSLLKQ